MVPMVYSDRDKMMQEVDALKRSGWCVLQQDDSERGTIGFVAVKDDRKKVFQWPIFGKILEPDVAVVSAKEMASLLEQDPNMYPCDDIRNFLVGFVWYRPDEGRAIVRRMSYRKLAQT